MNPLTNMKNVKKLSEQELKESFSSKGSWHDMYKDSAWIFVAGFPYTLSEGDLICVFSQYGEIVNINLVRDKESGKSRGFAFICYMDQRSTILSVDNLNGIKILDRTIRVDHVSNYKAPKENNKMDVETLELYMEGCAPKLQVAVENIKEENGDNGEKEKEKEKEKSSSKTTKEKKSKSKKHGKDKKKHKKEKKKRSHHSSDSDMEVKKIKKK